MKNIPVCYRDVVIYIILLSVFMFLISCHISVVVGIWMFICLKQNPVVCYPLIFQESPFWSPNSNGCHHKSQHVWKWKMASYFQGTFSTSWALPVPLSHSRFLKSLALVWEETIICIPPTPRVTHLPNSITSIWNGLMTQCGSL